MSTPLASSKLIYTHATDSYTVTQVTATGMAGFMTVIPGGSSSSIAGPDGGNAIIDSVAMEGSSTWKSELYLERTVPGKVAGVTVSGGGGDHGIYLSGAAPVGDKIPVTGFTGSDLQVQGCGWSNSTQCAGTHH